MALYFKPLPQIWRDVKILVMVRRDHNKFKCQLKSCDHDTCSLSVTLPCPSFISSAPLKPWDHFCVFLPFAVAGRSRPSTSALTAIVMPSLEPPHCSPGSTDIVLLPVSSNSSGLLGPVRKALLHRAPQVPANGSLGRGQHVMVFSQCQPPTTAYFLEGKYIQRAWMFLFLISLAEKEEQRNHFWNNALI